MRNTRSRGLGLDNMIRILQPLREEPRNFNQLFMSSGMRHRASFQSYMRFCTSRNFVKKERDIHHMVYSLDVKGAEFLNLMKVDSVDTVKTRMLVSQ